MRESRARESGRARWFAFVLALLLAGGGAGPASGQAVVVTGPPIEDDGFEAMQRRIVGVVAAIIDYTRDVRLSEPGLESVLAHHASLGEIHDGEDSRLVERAFVDGRYDFDRITTDAAYRAWCRDRGLDPEGFFRDLLRLQALRMREESLSGLDEAREEMPEQRAALEGMREEMGEDRYRGALESLEAAEAMVEETRTLMEGLPVPTPEEAELLSRHDERIRETLGEDAE